MHTSPSHHTAPAWFLAVRDMTTPKVKRVEGVTSGKWADAARARVDIAMLNQGLDPVTLLPLKRAKPLMRTNEIESFDFETPVHESHSDDHTEGLDTFDFSMSIE